MSVDVSAVLARRRILVVEDEYLIAADIAAILADHGAEVVGPAGSVRQAQTLIAGARDPIDGAMLDINLRGELVFPVADVLVARGIPFIFATGYDRVMVPARFGQVPRCEKPIQRRQAMAVLAAQLALSRVAAGSDPR